jgi:hypothetical protein
MKKLACLIMAFIMLSPVIANAETYTPSPDIVVTNAMTDESSGMGEMKFSLDNPIWTEPEPNATEKKQTLVGGDGQHCIWAMFSDRAGNWTESLRACAILDSTAPGGDIQIQGPEIIINFVSVESGG